MDNEMTGLEAWLQVLGSWIILFDTWGLINSFGIYQSFYETDLLSSHSSSDISWIGSIQGALLLIVGVISGPLYDAGYFRHMLIIGILLIVMGQFITSLCSMYWQFMLAQGFCTGLGMGLTYLPSTAILGQYFQKRRALAIGIAATGSPIAGIVLPIGFGWTSRIIAFILLALSAIPLVFMHVQAQPSNKVRSLFDNSLFKDGPFVLVMVGTFLVFLTAYIPFFYITVFANSHGLWTLDSTPYLVTMLNAGSIIGRIVPNALADRWGSLNITIICTVLSAALAFAWLHIRNIGGLIVFTLLYGMFTGGTISLLSSVYINFTPDASKVGARMGMACLLSGISLLIGTPICGAVLKILMRRGGSAQWRTAQ
ncbi:major facilitator superfamily domain-containing protein [Mariannaea sp. PMI_226]|nr:major facilitator superfamily domain-containing protein [Mariannaea sp. PMI_226]